MDEYQKCLEASLRFLSYRMRSEKEVRDNLAKPRKTKSRVTKSPITLETIEKVIAWLKEQKFIDDREFARQWMESRARSKPKSLMVIKLELRKKGVSQEIIEEVARNPETVIGDDLERARQLVGKKFRKYQGLEKKEIYQKLGAVLARNGFDWETIRKVIDEKLEISSGESSEA